MPLEISNDVVIQRKDLENHHEEADVIIVNQAIHAARCGASAIRVVSDDEDVVCFYVISISKKN